MWISWDGFSVSGEYVADHARFSCLANDRNQPGLRRGCRSTTKRRVARVLVLYDMCVTGMAKSRKPRNIAHCCR